MNADTTLLESLARMIEAGIAPKLADAMLCAAIKDQTHKALEMQAWLTKVGAGKDALAREFGVAA